MLRVKGKKLKTSFGTTLNRKDVVTCRGADFATQTLLLLVGFSLNEQIWHNGSFFNEHCGIKED